MREVVTHGQSFGIGGACIDPFTLDRSMRSWIRDRATRTAGPVHFPTMVASFVNSVVKEQEEEKEAKGTPVPTLPHIPIVQPCMRRNANAAAACANGSSSASAAPMVDPRPCAVPLDACLRALQTAMEWEAEVLSQGDDAALQLETTAQDAWMQLPEAMRKEWEAKHADQTKEQAAPSAMMMAKAKP